MPGKPFTAACPSCSTFTVQEWPTRRSKACRRSSTRFSPCNCPQKLLAAESGSTLPAARIAPAVEFARAHGFHAPVTEQPEYSMIRRQRVEQEILPYTESAGVGLVVWSPLAMGLLTGKYDEGKPQGARLTEKENWGKGLLTDENIEMVRLLKPIADGLGITRAQLALAWLLRQKGVSSVITGATKVAQIEDTVKAAGVRLTEDALRQIEEILNPS